MQRIAAIVLLLCSPAFASDGYPTKPDEMDKLCEVLGNTPYVGVSPPDRNWFRDHCFCLGKDFGCGYVNSERFKSRTAPIVNAPEKEQAGKAEARAPIVAKGRAATSAQRQAFWDCVDGPGGGECRKQADALEAACKAHGLKVSDDWTSPKDECYAPN